MKNWINLFIILFVILLAGCSTEETTTQPTQPSNPPSQQTKQAATQPFRFAVRGDFKPFNFEQDGRLTGFDVELGEEIARRIGMSPQPQKIPYDQLIAGLKEGKYQAIISSLSITPGRTQEIAFTKPYYVTGAQLFVLEQNQSTTVEQLKDKKIGVITRTPYMTLAQNHTKNVKEYQTHVQMLQELAAGKIDAILIDKMIGLTAIKEEGLKIKPIGSLIVHDEIAIALSQTNQDLLQQINKVLEDMIKDGTYGKISTKWFETDIIK